MGNIYSYSELYGPFTCEHKGCCKETSLIKVSDKDKELLEFWFPGNRSSQSNRVLSANMGKSLCDKHISDPVEANDVYKELAE